MIGFMVAVLAGLVLGFATDTVPGDVFAWALAGLGVFGFAYFWCVGRAEEWARKR